VWWAWLEMQRLGHAVLGETQWGVYFPGTAPQIGTVASSGEALAAIHAAWATCTVPRCRLMIWLTGRLCPLAVLTVPANLQGGDEKQRWVRLALSHASPELGPDALIWCDEQVGAHQLVSGLRFDTMAAIREKFPDRVIAGVRPVWRAALGQALADGNKPAVFTCFDGESATQLDQSSADRACAASTRVELNRSAAQAWHERRMTLDGGPGRFLAWRGMEPSTQAEDPGVTDWERSAFQ
jgi:hypothetical protein